MTCPPENSSTRLFSVNGGPSYGYNGLGDRIRETNAGVTTEYTMDLEAGLTQMLAGGTNVCLYGIGRIAQENPDAIAYFHGDALGSVR